MDPASALAWVYCPFLYVSRRVAGVLAARSLRKLVQWRGRAGWGG